jgi:hypothetical protein
MRTTTSDDANPPLAAHALVGVHAAKKWQSRGWVLLLLTAGFMLLARPGWAQDPAAPDTSLADTTRAETPRPDTTDAPAIDTWDDAAWTRILRHRGVAFDYIFYREADNHNDGVVVRLINANDYPVRYRFTIVFRAPSAEQTRRVRGRLQAGQMKTGDNDGLFWIPFPDGRSIGEIGLRGYDIARASEASSSR